MSDKATILGRVTADEGQPVAGAVITFKGSSPTHWDNALATGPGGHYRLVALLPGRYTILADSPEHGRAEATVEVAAGEVRRADFVLKQRE